MLVSREESPLRPPQAARRPQPPRTCGLLEHRSRQARDWQEFGGTRVSAADWARRDADGPDGRAPRPRKNRLPTQSESRGGLPEEPCLTQLSSLQE